MADSSLEETNLLTCPFNIPNHDVPVCQILPRWSDSHVAHPAIIITPRTEQDILSAIRFARRNRLRVIPAAGGHGAYVPIDSRTLYLDMKNFKSILVDKEAGIVRFGGGVLTGELIRALAAEGYYTSLVNSNAVGVVGSLLGGGHTSQIGILGWMVDNVLSFRLITAGGNIIEVGSSSTGDHLALFHALCGAGHGLGVITAATMQIHRLSDLSLPEHKIWTRTIIFPSTAINAVSETFLALHPPPKPLNVVLLFSRSPPDSPSPGSPILILAATYYGPAHEAEAATTSLSNPTLLDKAIKVDTLLVPLPNTNDSLNLFNTHGGYKDMCAARLHTLPQDSLKAAFARWLLATEEHPDASRSTVIFHSFNPSKLLERGDEPDSFAKFVEARDRGLNVVVVTWCYEVNTKDALSSYLDDMLSICRQGDAGYHVLRTSPNTMKFDVDLEELFTKERLAELDRLKKKWDGEGVFWSPYQRWNGHMERNGMEMSC